MGKVSFNRGFLPISDDILMVEKGFGTSDPFRSADIISASSGKKQPGRRGQRLNDRKPGTDRALFPSAFSI
jgi:hypothetical protein